MKIIAIGAVTAGGKTTVVNAVKDRLPRTSSLHFDNYSFEGEVEEVSEETPVKILNNILYL